MNKTKFAFILSVLTVAALVSATAFADFDQDGKADVFVVRSSGSCIWRECVEGAVRDFSEWRWLTSSGAAMTSDISLYDYNGDGSLELFYINSGNIIWRDTPGGDNVYGYVNRIDSGLDYHSVDAGDFDGDAYGDLFSIREGYMYWDESDGAEGMTRIAQMTWGSAVHVTVGNFDKLDGMDVLVSRNNGQVSWYESNGDNAFYFVDNFNDWYVKKMALGDLDGDLNPDFVVICEDPSQGNRNIVSWYENMVIPNVSIPRYLDGRGSILDIDAIDISIGDVDGDGSNELIVTHEDGGVRWYAGDSVTHELVRLDGTDYEPGALSIAISPVPGGANYDSPCAEIISGDVNSDCVVDISDLQALAGQWLSTNL